MGSGSQTAYLQMALDKSVKCSSETITKLRIPTQLRDKKCIWEWPEIILGAELMLIL